MSRRKRDVAFLKPEEPAFIARMKAQAGYKEGPTVDTKREALNFDEDSDDHDDEQPQVVVVKEGDLTAEEVSQAKREIEEAPADLNQRVVFRKPDKAKKNDNLTPESSSIGSEPISKRTKKEEKIVEDKKKEASKKQSKTKSVLSFTEDDDDDDGGS